MTDVIDCYKEAPPSLRFRLKQFAKERGIELTIAVVGLFVGIATVLVSYQVGKHQEILQASRMTDSYFNGIVELFAKSPDDNVRINLLMIARSEAIIEDLSRLNKPDKIASVIVFISNLKPQLFNEETQPELRRSKFIDLSYLNLANTHLHNLDLKRAVMGGTNLKGADLSKTNLENAYLQSALLQEATLSRTNFKSADLRGADLTGAYLEKTNFEGALLEGAIWINGRRCKTGSIGVCLFK